MEDAELLRKYAEEKSESAFRELVHRHLPLVYGTALRMLQQPSAAQDVAQNVFIQLSCQAARLRGCQTLPGWLYRTTQREVFHLQRGEHRRRQRETQAMNLAEQTNDQATRWDNLSPLLDDALGRLKRVDQDALLLRFFDGRSLQETGRALALSEAAAQKRVARALEKMRAHLSRRGLTLSTALLATSLDVGAKTTVPSGLVTSISATAMAAPAAIVAPLTFSPLTSMISSKLTLIIATVLALVALGITLIFRPPSPLLVKQQLPPSPPVSVGASDSTPQTPPPVPVPSTLTANAPASTSTRIAPPTSSPASATTDTTPGNTAIPWSRLDPATGNFTPVPSMTGRLPTAPGAYIRPTQPRPLLFPLVDYANADIPTVLRDTAAAANLTVDFPPALAGLTSVTLHHVDWKTVYEVVLRPLGYKFALLGNNISIDADPSAPPLQYMSFPFPFSSADKMVAGLQDSGLMQQIEMLTIDQNDTGRILIIIGNPAAKRQIQEVLDQLQL